MDRTASAMGAKAMGGSFIHEWVSLSIYANDDLSGMQIIKFSGGG